MPVRAGVEEGEETEEWASESEWEEEKEKDEEDEREEEEGEDEEGWEGRVGLPSRYAWRAWRRVWGTEEASGGEADARARRQAAMLLYADVNSGSSATLRR
jgi:hypothetical protein